MRAGVGAKERRSADGVLHRLRARAARLDGIERVALVFVATGIALLAARAWLGPMAPFSGAIASGATEWAPGLVTDGVLLWVVNAVLHRHERRRVIAQVGSLSREFALDATRRARDEGWLVDGSMVGQTLARSSLAGADLSGADLRETDLSFSDLNGATLAYADLRGANLTGADLREADLRWARLDGARLGWADLRDAMLEGAGLTGVDARFAAVDARQAEHPALAGAIAGGFLDERQMHEVRRTFDLLLERGTAPIERFYQRLFQVEPATRHMFRNDPAQQARKFLGTLKVIVSALHTPARHVAMLQRLGERHGGYGVAPHHYALVSQTLLSVFDDELGAEFTPLARASWQRAFDLMSSIMTGGRAGGGGAHARHAARAGQAGHGQSEPVPA